ncbi:MULTISPECIES: heptaprenyl diphosphate synthase component 1 [Sutcliffiella]|uniref:heptaprenyl diphosphate synthase component 1 n=1 Tax=Sutcliffiella TaxID=2837511 RepID=UPI000ADA1E3F|nr:MULTISPECIES: heptaprenyl diphosphate synthase component 1 [Sutcliffiella]WBL13487.1 heptaprenyl diphosphate synthase component 1 [Sutcliffiella sp. NC1]
MEDVQIHISNLKEKIQEKIQHNYLFHHIPYPIIDEDKILILHSLLEPLSLTKEKKEQYILSTMLAQIALDTHEEVHSHNDMDEKQFKAQQLTVLAGDFFSGLYFQLLANAEDIPMIRTLAHSIKEINEYKITLYQNGISKMDDLLDCIRNIESSLIQGVSDYVDEAIWSDLSGNILLLKRLVNERELFIQKKPSLLVDNIKKLIELDKSYKEEIINIFDEYIAKLWKMIHSVLAGIPHTNFLKERLASFVNELPFSTNLYAEEG